MGKQTIVIIVVFSGIKSRLNRQIESIELYTAPNLHIYCSHISRALNFFAHDIPKEYKN